MPLGEEAPDLDLIAASLRSDAVDTHTFFETLATKLEEALPHMVTVTRRREGLRGPRLVREIIVDAAGERLELRREGAAVAALRARRSGGITLRTERLEIDLWLELMSAIMADQAQRSQQTRVALARLLDT